MNPIRQPWKGTMTGRERFLRQMHWQSVDRCFNMEFGYWKENFQAWRMFRENGITNTAFFAGDMKDVLQAEFIAENGQLDIVVLDPPRAGIHPSVAHVLLECAPKRMVYVSCNPATQARDLAVFADHYDIIHVQPVDMFPHTTHVENVVSLIHKVL